MKVNCAEVSLPYSMYRVWPSQMQTCLLLPKEEHAFRCPEAGFVSAPLHTGPTSPHLHSSRLWGWQPLWEAAPPLPCRTLTLLPAPPEQVPLETRKRRCLHTSAWTGVFIASFAECQRLNTQCVSLTSCDVAANGMWNAYDSIWQINKMLLLLFGESILSSIWSVIGLAHNRCLMAVRSEAVVLTRDVQGDVEAGAHIPKGAVPWKLPETRWFFFSSSVFPSSCISFWRCSPPPHGQ